MPDGDDEANLDGKPETTDDTDDGKQETTPTT
jgi:hypothetical protein